MKITSLLCLLILMCSQVFTTQVTGTPTATSTPSPADSTPVSKPSTSIEATLHSGMNVGILFGYGFKSGYDFGAGVRMGYSTNRLYLGGIFMYHFGRALAVQTGTLLTSSELYGYSIAGEIGYDVLLEKKAIVRPYIGVGSSNFKGSSSIVGAIPDSTGSIPVNFSDKQSDINLLISPGILVQFPLSPDLLFGGDLRYNIVTGDGDYTAFGLYTTFMFRF